MKTVFKVHGERSGQLNSTWKMETILARSTARRQWQSERGFGRLKEGWFKVAPIFLRTDEHIRGLMFILSIVLRAFTLIEFVVRRELQAQHYTLTGLYGSAPNKTTDRPTTERLLNAFQGITLLQIRIGHEVQYQLNGF